jgi:hypothetical protein
MTLADLPVLNPSSPGREARRALLVAALFAIFGVLYALARAAALAPPDLATSTDVIFGFAYPAGWGISPALWSGAATWPTALARSDMGTALAVAANLVMVIALIVVMYPDILARQGPQYVSPARRILTVGVAFVLAFLMYKGVNQIDNVFTSDIGADPGGARRQLFGLAALAAIVFAGVWSFIGPKDFGRRIPLRISHGALGGIALWSSVSLATLLSSQPRAFISSSLDTFYTLLTVDAGAGHPGATFAWAVSADVLTAAAAMALCGALMVTTSPQTLGPANRRAAAIVSLVLAAFLLVVAGTTWSQTKQHADAVQASVVRDLALDVNAPARTPVVLAGQSLTTSQRLIARTLTRPDALADDCANATGIEDRVLPAATAANVQKLTAWLDTHSDEVSGLAVRVASCRASLQALLWEPDAAREGIFLSGHPERVGAITYLYAMSGISTPRPALQRRILAALSDTALYRHGVEAATRFANLARVSGDTTSEAAWRQSEIQPSDPSLITNVRPRPAYTDGAVNGRIVAPQRGWRIALLIADEPGAGTDPLQQAPKSDGQVLASMVTATDVGPDGGFTFTGLRDGFYQLALLSPEGMGVPQLARLTVRGDPGVFQLPAAPKTKNVGTVTLTF